MSNAIISWKEQLEKDAAKAVANATADETFIGTKGGNLSIGDNQIPNNELECIVLADVTERRYYASAYDADNTAPPDCFAQAVEPDNMAPHEAVPRPVHENCNDCPMAVFGSAPGTSKGPACKTRIKLMVIAAGDAPTPESISAAQPLSISTPPTSAKNWRNYAGKLGQKGAAPWTVVTNLSTKPSKFMFSMNFAPVGKIVGDELMQAVFAKVPGAVTALLTPYEYEDEGVLKQQEASKSKMSKR